MLKSYIGQVSQYVLGNLALQGVATTESPSALDGWSLLGAIGGV
jgi:hypothetical protein